MQPPAAKPARRSSIELGRYLAACGIALYHCQIAPVAVWHAGLIYFTVLTVLFGLQTRARSLAELANRLLVPWVIWSVLYGLPQLAEVATTSRTLAEEFAWHMLLTGPSMHLWYLPFAFVVCVATSRVSAGQLKCIGRAAPLATAGVATLVGTALVAGCAELRVQTAGVAVLGEWLTVLPAVAFGVAIAATGPAPTRGRLLALLLPPVTLLAAVAWIGPLAWTAMLVTYGVGLAGLGLALAIRPTDPPPGQPTGAKRGRGNQFACTLGKLSFGVYLVHPFLMSVARRSGLDPETLLGATVVVAVSTLAAYLLHRSPAARLA